MQSPCRGGAVKSQVLSPKLPNTSSFLAQGRLKSYAQNSELVPHPPAMIVPSPVTDGSQKGHWSSLVQSGAIESPTSFAKHALQKQNTSVPMILAPASPANRDAPASESSVVFLVWPAMLSCPTSSLSAHCSRHANLVEKQCFCTHHHVDRRGLPPPYFQTPKPVHVNMSLFLHVRYVPARPYALNSLSMTLVPCRLPTDWGIQEIQDAIRVATRRNSGWV